MEFLSDHQNERFNIKVDESEYSMDYSRFKILNAINSNIYIVTSLAQEKYKILQKNDIKFYFEPKCPATDFRLFEYMCSLGATDIYIADDLCYNLKKVKRAAEHFNVQVRLILDEIPSIVPEKEFDIRAP